MILNVMVVSARKVMAVMMGQAINAKVIMKVINGKGGHIPAACNKLKSKRGMIGGGSKSLAIFLSPAHF